MRIKIDEDLSLIGIYGVIGKFRKITAVSSSGSCSPWRFPPIDTLSHPRKLDFHWYCCEYLGTLK
jgi:hypothetical protein